MRNKKKNQIDPLKVPRGHMAIPKGKAFKHKNDRRTSKKVIWEDYNYE